MVKQRILPIAAVALLVIAAGIWIAVQMSINSSALAETPPGTIRVNGLVHLTGESMADRLVVSGSPGAPVISLYHWRKFQWQLRYQTSGVDPEGVVLRTSTAPMLGAKRTAKGLARTRYIGTYSLLPGNRDVLLTASTFCTTVCSGETVRVADWKIDQLQGIFTIGGAPIFTAAQTPGDDKGITITGNGKTSVIRVLDNSKLGIEEGGAFQQTAGDLSEPY